MEVLFVECQRKKKKSELIYTFSISEFCFCKESLFLANLIVLDLYQNSYPLYLTGKYQIRLQKVLFLTRILAC